VRGSVLQCVAARQLRMCMQSVSHCIRRHKGNECVGLRVFGVDALRFGYGYDVCCTAPDAKER